MKSMESSKTKPVSWIAEPNASTASHFSLWAMVIRSALLYEFYNWYYDTGCVYINSETYYMYYTKKGCDFCATNVSCKLLSVPYKPFSVRVNREAFGVNLSTFRVNRETLRVNRSTFRVNREAFRANRSTFRAESAGFRAKSYGNYFEQSFWDPCETFIRSRFPSEFFDNLTVSK